MGARWTWCGWRDQWGGGRRCPRGWTLPRYDVYGRRASQPSARGGDHHCQRTSGTWSDRLRPPPGATAAFPWAKTVTRCGVDCVRVLTDEAAPGMVVWRLALRCSRTWPDLIPAKGRTRRTTKGHCAREQALGPVQAWRWGRGRCCQLEFV